MAMLAAGLSLGVVADRSGPASQAQAPYLRQQPLSCEVHPAHFTLLRAQHSVKVTPPLPSLFLRNTQDYLTDDPRNFHLTTTQAELDAAGVFKRQVFGPGGSAPLLGVANYHPPKQVFANVERPSDLTVYVADPTGGNIYGVLTFGVGCHD
jgi:hypothetical protein